MVIPQGSPQVQIYSPLPDFSFSQLRSNLHTKVTRRKYYWVGEKAGSGIRPLGFDYSYSMYYLCDPVYIIWLLYFLLKALTHFIHLYKAQKIKRHLFLGRKAMTNLDSILKSRDITMPTKVCRVKTMVFPVVMYGCESWTIKKAGHQRIDTFELWCWKRLLRVPWTARKSNPSILKEISPKYSLEGLMLKLKL